MEETSGGAHTLQSWLSLDQRTDTSGTRSDPSDQQTLIECLIRAWYFDKSYESCKHELLSSKTLKIVYVVGEEVKQKVEYSQGARQGLEEKLALEFSTEE